MPGISFLKSSILEYDNIASDPFDGAVSPIAYIPDWSKPENMNKSRPFASGSIDDFIEIPEYNLELLSDSLQKTTSATILRYTYPVVYMGSYRGNYAEYDGSHAGVDIRAPIGTPVLSVANGVVVKVKDTDTGDGKYVIIRHDNVDMNGVKETLYSGYEHLSEIIAIEGTKIKRGEVLGKVGMTGITTTPHLHFQIDKSTSPFHLYWPYTFREASDLGLDFFGAINVGLGKENAIRYTVHPMSFIKDHPFLGSAPKEKPVILEEKKEPLVVSTETVVDTTIPNSNVVETVIPKIETAPVVEPVKEPTVTPIVVEPVKEPIVSIPEPTVAPVIESVVEPTKTLSTFVPDSEHIFSDIATDSPYYLATKYLREANVARGYAEDGGFHPNDRISRSETILLYDRLFASEAINTDIELPYLDILPSDELNQALIRAFTKKIVVTGNYFRPNDSLTRAEAITLLIRTSGIPLDTTKYSLFKDVNKKSSHMVYINTFAKYLGIKGKNFEPNKAITRGELAKILYLFNEQAQKESN